MTWRQQLYHSVFPSSFELNSKDQQLLQFMYPDINWEYVTFYTGMPWFMHFSFAYGTALPHTYNGKNINIYIKAYHDLSVRQRLLLLVHEAFHIQQYHELNSMAKKTSGWGFNRRFMRYYLGWYFQTFYTAYWQKKMPWDKAKYHAYRQHPMEIPAYNHEAAFEKLLLDFRGHSAAVFFQQNSEIMCKNAEVPRSPSFGFKLMGTSLSLFFSILTPFITILLMPIAFLIGKK